MPVTTGITQDTCYQQDLADSMKQVSTKMARRLLIKGSDLYLVKETVNNLSQEEPEEIQRTVSNEKFSYLASGIQTVISVLPRLAQA